MKVLRIHIGIILMIRHLLQNVTSRQILLVQAGIRRTAILHLFLHSVVLLFS